MATPNTKTRAAPTTPKTGQTGPSARDRATPEDMSPRMPSDPKPKSAAQVKTADMAAVAARGKAKTGAQPSKAAITATYNKWTAPKRAKEAAQGALAAKMGAEYDKTTPSPSRPTTGDFAPEYVKFQHERNRNAGDEIRAGRGYPGGSSTPKEVIPPPNPGRDEAMGGARTTPSPVAIGRVGVEPREPRTPSTAVHPEASANKPPRGGPKDAAWLAAHPGWAAKHPGGVGPNTHPTRGKPGAGPHPRHHPPTDAGTRGRRRKKPGSAAKPTGAAYGTM